MKLVLVLRFFFMFDLLSFAFMDISILVFFENNHVLLESVGHDPKPYKKQISELRYSGVKTDRVPTLLEVIR